MDVTSPYPLMSMLESLLNYLHAMHDHCHKQAAIFCSDLQEVILNGMCCMCSRSIVQEYSCTVDCLNTIINKRYNIPGSVGRLPTN